MADPFANPMLEAMNVSDRPDPFAPWTPTSSIGLGGLAPSMADMAVTGERLIRQSQFGLPEMRKPPAANIGLSPTGDRLFVNGFETGVEDYASVLESERYLGGPSAGIPEGYTPLTQAQYSQYLQDIRDPSLGQLFKRGFESGGQQFTQLIGGALQAAGAEETGARIVTSAGERLRQLAPFQREFTEIDSAGDMIDWFVSTLGTQTPLFLESVATAIAGAALGSATASPGLGTVGGAIAGFFGKKAFRDNVEAAAKRYRAGQVTKDSAEYALLKNASAVAGGTIASGVGEYILGVGDVYNELREQGANPEDASARLTAAAAGLPYAALSILPEAMIVGRILGAGGRAALPAPTTTTRVTPGGKTVVTTSPSLPRRGAELLRRGIGGAALYGGIEGASEAAQEGLVMGVSGQDLTSDEAIRRFINSFAAGAAVGGVLGGVANLRSRTPEGEPAPESKEPVNLLAPVSEPEMVSGTEGRPDFVAGAEVRPSRPSDTLYRGQVEPGQFGGAQGVLDLGGPTPTIGELRERSMQTGALPPNLLYDQETGQYSQEARIGDTGYDRLALPAPAPVADPNQLVLQFAPPAPEPVAQNVPPPTTAMGQQLLSIQRQQQFQAAQAQLEAQRQAELDRLGNVAQAQRQVDIAFPQEPQAQIPTREVAPPQQPVPRQLPLFTPAQAPRPSRGEALRMGIAGAGLPPLDREPTAAPRVDLRRSGQLPLFTQAGEPSVAALRQRAEPTVPTVEAGATQAPPTGFRGKPLTAFQRRAAAKFDELSGEGAFATLDADQRQEWYTEFKKFEDSQATKKPKEKKDAVLKREAKETKTQYRVTYDGKPATVTIIRMKDDPTKIDDVTIKVDGEQFAAVSFGKQGAVTDAKMLNNLIEIEAIDAKGEPDAVPKQGAAKVPVQPKAKPSEKVGKKVRDTKKPAAKGEALKKKKVTKATDDDFERVLGKYNALSPAQRSQVAAKLGVTREQMPDLLDERTLDVDKAIDEVVGEPKTKKDEAAEAAKPTEKPKAPPPPTPATSRELFDTTVESIETTKDPYEYRMAMMVLFDYAFFPDSNDTKAGITKEALDFVNDLPVDKAFRQAVSVVIQDTGTIDAKKNADLFNTIVRAGMLSDVMASTDIKNLPNEYKVNQVNGDPVSQPKKVDGGLRSEGSVVADLIQELNTRTSAMPAAQQKTNIQKLVELYKAAKAAGQEDHESASGDPISSFFDADGNPYTYIVSKKLRVSTKPITKEQARALEDVGADIDDDYESPLSLDDWNYSRDVPDSDTGRYFRDDGRQITAPVPVGRVQLLVATFLRALSVKPRVSIFKNQADLKARNPELYRRAKAARPQGDFDVASAVGYSFGDGNVIIFSDRVATEQQLRFVLAHETLGHFGMRSLIGDQKFNALMERIYNLDSAIRNGVDAAMAARKKPKAEVDLTRRRIVQGIGAALTVPKMPTSLVRAFEVKELTSDAVWKAINSAESWFDSIVDNTLEQFTKSDTKKFINLRSDALYGALERIAGKKAARFVGSLEYADPIDIYLDDFIEANKNDPQILSKIQRAYDVAAVDIFKALSQQLRLKEKQDEIFTEKSLQKDAALENKFSSAHAEATEEFLADFAAQLDVSIVARIWNAIKNALNKLGVKFGDEAARYLISQSRRYVRNGDMSAMFDTKQVFRNLAAMETGQDPYGTGRFAQATDMRGDNIAAGLMQNNIGGLPSSLTEAAKFFTNSGIDTSAKLDRFLATFFSLLNYRARENPGFSAIHDVISAGRDLSMQMKVTMQEKLAPVLNRAVKFGYGNYSLGEAGGITEAQTADVNNLLYAGQRLAVSKLKDYRTLGKEQFFSVGEDGQLKPNQDEIDRIYKMGLLTFEQAKNGFEYEALDFTGEKEGQLRKFKFEGIKDLTEDDIRWRGYLLSRESVRDVELKLLEARNLAYIQDRDLAFREIADITTDKELTPEENRNLDRLYKKYRDLYTANKIVNEDGDPTLNPESIEDANDFIVAVNSAILGKASDRNAAVAAYFQGKTADDVVAFIEAFKKRLIIPDDNVTKFTIQNRMKDIIIAEIGNEDADLFTKRSLATGYTPLLREGAYEVRVTAYDKAGNRVRLQQEYKDQLVYSQFDNESEALAMAESINDNLFEGKTYKVQAYNPQTMQFEQMDVALQAEPSTALDAIAAPPDLNLNEFTRGLRQFGIVLNPNKMEQVILALTKQNAKARQRLQRAFVEGAKPDAVIAITQHIESRASTIAKVTMRPKLNELMNLGLSQTQKLWNGDRQLLDTLKKNWETVEKDPNATEEQKTIAKREYDKYAYMFSKTNVERTGRPTVLRGNMYYNEAARQLAFLDNNKAIEESDFASGKVASTIRSYTSMAQLGASFATGALNYIGAVTNGLPYLATYNSKTAFGGGFGLGKSTSEFLVALNQVGLRNALLTKGGMNTAEFFDGVARSPQMQKQYGIAEHEARFLAREIREGVMIPAQSNALTATSRGRATTGLGQKTMDTIMWTFNSTEQASRRALGLTAYRLAYQREIAGGTSEKDAALKARDFAVEALRFTVGEYSVTNRPPAWKSGIQSFLYMYKVFPTTSIQLLSRLPPRGQVIMLTALFILGGITSFPLAEDLEDLVDTIAQSLGWKQGSIRGEIAKLIDEVAPGMSPYVLSGLANSVFTGDIGVRTSLGNFIPGTGLLLAGANTTRELMEIGGPAAGFLQQSFNTVVDTLQLAFTEKKTFADVLRDSPVTMARAFGDAYTYTQAGAIIDKRGYVVSPDVSTAEIVTRVLGFYPERASSEYQQIRISKRTADYQRQVSSGFQQAWIKAKMMGDDDRADAVADAVKDWNQAAKGTALEIRNFTRNANRALREAERPAMERFLRTAPRASREEIDRAATLLGYEEE
jgi:hypothetical protein